MDTLPVLEPEVGVGDKVRCPHCLRDHVLYRSPNSSLLLLFDCYGVHTGAVAGRLVVGEFPRPEFRERPPC